MKTRNVGTKNTFNRVLQLLLKNSTSIVFLLMLVIASLSSDAFFTERNIFNLLRQVAALGIVSMGMLLVILTAGIDLSVGSIMAVASVVLGIFIQNYSFFIAALIALAAGVAMGAVSGYLVAKWKMAPFVATLAMMTIARGLALIFAKGSPILIEDKVLSYIGLTYWLRIPFPVFIMLLVFLFVYLLLKYTIFGRLVKAIGSNETSVLLAGIQVPFYKFMVYCISGLFCALGGIISTARTSVASPIISQGFELDAIAAVVIGGASLAGGKGTALNTLLGVIILGMISNFMNLMNIPGYHQQVVKGIIIIVAVIFQGIEPGKIRVRKVEK